MQGFGRIQYIITELYVESNVPQFSGYGWRLKPWERDENELINSTDVTFMCCHHVVKFYCRTFLCLALVSVFTSSRVTSIFVLLSNCYKGKIIWFCVAN